MLEVAAEAGLAADALKPDTWHGLPRAFRTCAASAVNSVLLETAKRDGSQDKSLLFLHPSSQLIAWNNRDLEHLLQELDRHLAEGAFVAGYFAYECGESFVGLASAYTEDTRPSEPLAWLGVYEAPIEFDHATGVTRGSLPDHSDVPRNEAIIHADGLQISREDYGAALARIKEHLEAGHTYQVNFTDRITGHSDADALAVYETLLRQQPVPFAAFINRAEAPMLSFSPELFFRTTQGRITVRPMKGTWARGSDLEEDLKAAWQLQNDEKNRSEHVMIVDLLRNDLGRICQYGSVNVDDLFHVEPYNTLLQMTSTCSGLLNHGISPSQVFASLFPSGSITGAPKRKTMEIIRELEKNRRGIYTGAIGYFAPGGEACFNVAIRTVQIERGNISMGVGGGITAGSNPDDEFEECKLKASFLTNRRPRFALIETMRCDGSIPLLPLHMERLAKSAKYFDIPYDEQKLLNDLASAVSSCGNIECRIRVELDEKGLWRIETDLLEPVPWNGRLLLAEERTQSRDVFLRHKTTNRKRYDRSLADARILGFDEVLFLNEQATVTEGCISNILALIDQEWLTPTLASGVLPGVQRRHLLHSIPGIEERDISIEKLLNADSICVYSALRGLRPVLSIARINGDVLWRAKQSVFPEENHITR